MTRLFILTLAVSCLGLLACDPGAECLESCNENADCIAGHSCISFEDGKKCAPVECEACADVCRIYRNPNAEASSTCIWEGCEGD